MAKTSEKEGLLRGIRDKASTLRELIEKDEAMAKEEGIATIKGLLTGRKFIKAETFRKGYGKLILIIRKNLLGKMFLEVARYDKPLKCSSFRDKIRLEKADAMEIVTSIVSLAEDFSPGEIILK